MITMDGKYTTRDGQPVRVLTLDRANANTPVVFLRTDKDGKEYIECCDLNGKWSPLRSENYGFDLIPVKQYRFKTLAELCKDYPDLVIASRIGLCSPTYNRTILSHNFIDQLGKPCDHPEIWESYLLTEINSQCHECPF